jgi:hypothetical protein
LGDLREYIYESVVGATHPKSDDGCDGNHRPNSRRVREFNEDDIVWRDDRTGRSSNNGGCEGCRR